MEPWSFDLRGRFDEHLVESEALKGNPLGDPHERPLSVYTPPPTKRIRIGGSPASTSSRG